MEPVERAALRRKQMSRIEIVSKPYVRKRLGLLTERKADSLYNDVGVVKRHLDRREFAALSCSNQEELYIAEAGQEASIASPLPLAPHPHPRYPRDGVEFRIRERAI